MKRTLQLLNQIASVSTEAEKKDIIKEGCKDPMFRNVVTYSLDQNRSYNLSKLPQTETTNQVPSVKDIFRTLDYLSGKRGATADEAITLLNFCGRDPDTVEVVNRILKKDLRCGCRAKTFNKVVKGLIYQVPYQRYKSSKFIKDIDFENDIVWAQIKNNGMFSYMEYNRAGIEFTSRNGSKFTVGEGLTDNPHGEWASGRGLIWMGELLVMGDDGKYMSRQAGNGIINKFISGEGDDQYNGRIHYVTWGFILRSEYDARVSETSYEDMWNTMMRLNPNPESNIKVAKSYPIKSLKQARDLYVSVRERKEEGLMLKVVNKLKWRDQQSGTPHGVKMKPVAEADMEIVSAYYGAAGKKYEYHMGGLLIKTSCGGILTKVGMGFSDKEREKGVDWWNEQAGKIIAVEFTEVITDKTDRKTMCFDACRFVETRFNEKTEADTLEYCIEEGARK